MNTIILIMAAVGCLSVIGLFMWLTTLAIGWKKDSTELNKLKNRLIMEKIEQAVIEQMALQNRKKPSNVVFMEVGNEPRKKNISN